MTGKESAQAAQYAAGAARVAHNKPRPPSHAGRKARRRASRPSGAALAEEPQTAWSGASAYAADWEGSTVRSKCCGSQAHCSSSASKPCSCSRRSLAHTETNWGAPMCVPSNKHTRATVCRHSGALPRHDCRRAFCLGRRHPRQAPQRQKTLLRARYTSSCKKAARNSPGRCARAHRAGANASPCSQPTRRPAHSHRPVGCGGRRRHRPTTSTPARTKGTRASLPRVCQGRQPGTPSHKRNARQETRRWQREARRPGNPSQYGLWDIRVA